MRKRLDGDFELRGNTYELWNDDEDGRCLVHPITGGILELGDNFDPTLSGAELLRVYEFLTDGQN